MNRAWKSIALGSNGLLLEMQPGYACGKKDVVGGVVHLRMNNVSKDGAFDTTLLRRIPQDIAEKHGKFAEKGDVIFVNTNSTELVGKSVAFPGWVEPCAFSNHLTKLRPNPDKLDSVWLHLCFRSLWHGGFFAANCIEFIGQSTFNKEQLRKLEIPVPPLVEQRRLVARIEALTSRLEQARRARQAALAEADNLLRIAQRSYYERLLVEEETTLLGEVGDVISGGTPAKSIEAYWDGDVPWVAPKEMKRFRIGESSMNVTQHAVDEGAAKLVHKPAVLMVVRGMILAKRVPVAVSTRSLTINQDMKAFIPKRGLDVSFLGHMLCGASEELQTRVEVAGHGTCKLETSAWSPLPIPVPSPAEQRRIVARLDALAEKQTELRRLQTETEAELAAFTPALLAKAFRGEL